MGTLVNILTEFYDSWAGISISLIIASVSMLLISLLFRFHEISAPIRISLVVVTGVTLIFVGLSAFIKQENYVDQLSEIIEVSYLLETLVVIAHAWPLALWAAWSRSRRQKQASVIDIETFQ